MRFSSQQYSYQRHSQLLQKFYLAGFIVLLGSLFYYQIIKGDYYFQRAQNNYIRAMPIRAIRGSIFDRNGRILAYDRASFNLSVIPYQVRKQKDDLFAKVSAFLGCEAILLQKNYAKNMTSYFAPVDIIRGIDKTLALQLKEELGDLIVINPQPQRYYPYGYECAHLLGYTKEAQSFYEKLKQYGYSPLERVGFVGIEQYYNDYLRGEDGGDLIEIDAKGNAVGFLGKRIPKKGKDIYLTIDAALQEIARNSMKTRRGVIILMNSQTGELITLYSSPSFDPNLFVQGGNLKKLLSDVNSPLLNRAIQTTYPLGSTFKPILAAAALQENKITPHTSFRCEGEMRFGIRRFRCLKSHGDQNLYQAIKHSCNIYFYNLGLLLGPNLMSYWAKKFALDSYVGVDLPYEKKGLIPSVAWKKKTYHQPWFTGDTLNFAIGQGYVRSTPLELTVAINALFNGGYLLNPYLLKQVGDTPSTLTMKSYINISEVNLNILKKAMRDTVRSADGTASVLEDLNLDLAGKTGTAQTSGKAHGWFVGAFPYKNPQYTICVFVENAGSSYEALKVVHLFLKHARQGGLL